MQDVRQIQFMTIYYSKLQGLKSVPVSLLLLLTCLWVNTQHGPARNFILFAGFALGCILLYWGIDRYYQRRYGKVENSPQQKRADYYAGILGGLAGLAAVYVDFTYRLTVSMIGLVFTAAILADYLRIYRKGKKAYYLWQLIICSGVILVADLLPLLGVKYLWFGTGWRAQFLAFLVIVSIVMLVAGVCGHIYFIRQLPPKEGRA